jgi:dihydrofolate synthase / folylpolyglutamate synthase
MVIPMNYKETIQYLYAQLPMFHREGKSAYKADLVNITKLAEALGSPQNNFKCIHIAGTNGKGSVCHMLASVLQEAGYKTGLFTSPHLVDFRERLRINGQMIAEETIVSFVDKNRLLIETIKPSFFEMTAALAFDYFSKEGIEVAVLETGLGGRLDATNIVNPVITAITNISLDHTDILGNNLEAIAVEKAGIIKYGIPVIIGESNPETRQVFMKKAEQNKAKLIFAEEVYTIENSSISYPDRQIINLKKYGQPITIQYKLDLLGNYQTKNLATVLTIIDQIRNLKINIPDKSVNEGLENTVRNTGFSGRWQILGNNPLIIADTGHNEDGLKAVMKQLKKLPCKNLLIIYGMVNDKDVRKALAVLPKNAIYFFTKASIPRALHEQILLKEGKMMYLTGKSYPTVKEAISAAKNQAKSEDCIYIGGSTFVVGEALMDLNRLITK